MPLFGKKKDKKEKDSSEPKKKGLFSRSKSKDKEQPSNRVQLSQNQILTFQGKRSHSK